MQRVGSVLGRIMHDAALGVLAQKLRIPSETFREALEIRARGMAKGDPMSPYRRFSRPKRSGGVRWITAPHDTLKEVRRAIYEQILLPAYEPSAITHGFIRGRDIRTNAQAHIIDGQLPKSALNIDFKDAFPSVRGKTVYEIFRRLTDSHEMAMILGYLCTWDSAIPQGAPTSPMVLNFALREFDEKFAELGRKHGLTVSRYVDDLTLSSAELERIPDKIFTHTARLGKKFGFMPNMEKVWFVPPRRGPISVTGLNLVLDGGEQPCVRLPAATRRWFRHTLHYTAHMQPEELTKEQIGACVGMVGFARYIHGEMPHELLEPYEALLALGRLPTLHKLKQRKWREISKEFELAYADLCS